MNTDNAENAQTSMRRETRMIPALARRQLDEHIASYQMAGAALRQRAPRLVITLARGSSDNAATYFKYLAELSTGIPVASIGPSIASVYQRRLRLDETICLAISQSGRSPDLISFQAMAGKVGAYNLALVNAANSPLADGADLVIPIGAGQEQAVAATKSYVCSLTAIGAMIADWTQDVALTASLAHLPDCLDASLQCDWQDMLGAIGEFGSVFVIGRGPAFAIAQESALKFKETCQLHAESYSAAEVLHGPIQLAASGLIALVYLSRDEARAGICHAVERMAEAGIKVFVADPVGERPVKAANVAYLPCIAAPTPALDPICQIVSFYIFAETLARRLGLNPDAPPLLRKVTETL